MADIIGISYAPLFLESNESINIDRDRKLSTSYEIQEEKVNR